MTDPFSVAVGVVSLVALTTKAIKVTEIYCREAKYSKESAEELQSSLHNPHSNLSRLDKLLKSDKGSYYHFGDTTVLVASTSACRKRLDLVNTKLNEACKASSNGLSRLKWPFEVKEHRKIIAELKDLSQLIQFALSIDSCALLSRTYDQVCQSLSEQLGIVQSLRDVVNRLNAIEESTSASQQILEDSLANIERN